MNKQAILSLLVAGLITGSYIEFQMNQGDGAGDSQVVEAIELARPAVPAEPTISAEPSRRVADQEPARLLVVIDGRLPPISVAFIDEPINDVLEVFAIFTGRSIVASGGVTGFVTAEINDQPWDVAFRAILLLHGLGATQDEDGNIRIDEIRR